MRERRLKAPARQTIAGSQKVSIVSHSRSVPLYQQVYDSIADEIAHAQLRPNDRLPSERVLCERFGVSRVTLRRALARLAADKAIVSSRGRGWFVSSGPLSEPPDRLVSFSEMGLARGLVPSSRTLSAQTRPATLDEAEALTVAPGSELFCIERLRLLDHVPIAVTDSRIPLRRVPDLPNIDLSSLSLYDVLEERFGIVPSWATYTVTAVPADRRHADALDVRIGSPLLMASQTTNDQNDRPVELGEVFSRPDRYRFRATLSRRP